MTFENNNTPANRSDTLIIRVKKDLLWTLVSTAVAAGVGIVVNIFLL